MMSNEAALADLAVAEQKYQSRREASKRAIRRSFDAGLALQEAMYRVVVSVACPYCHAEPGVNCLTGYKKMAGAAPDFVPAERSGDHYNLQHGVRQEASGLHLAVARMAHA